MKFFDASSLTYLPHGFGQKTKHLFEANFTSHVVGIGKTRKTPPCEKFLKSFSQLVCVPVGCRFYRGSTGTRVVTPFTYLPQH